MGGGIWQSGGGLVSDGPGTFLLTTGNGIQPGATPGGTIPGDTPPASLGETVVRLNVQPNGSLKAVDFFAPYDAPALDTNDLDFGSGSPVALPASTSGRNPYPSWASPSARRATSTYSTATIWEGRAKARTGPTTSSDASGPAGACGRARRCGRATEDGSISPRHRGERPSTLRPGSWTPTSTA